jgi:hypothetical protein
MRGGGEHARLRGERQPHITLPSYIQKPFARILFAIKNLLNGERGFGGGQPCGLAAASAWGRRPPSAGGGPTKYHQLAFRNSLHRIGIRRSLRRYDELEGLVPFGV